MVNAYDIAYTLGLGLASPFWLVKPSARRKVLKALSQRMGHCPQRDLARPAVMIHAVSLGEINATRGLVQQLAQARPDLQFVISATTDTGFARGQELYGKNPDVSLIRYPLDFSSAVARCLDALRPSLVVLMELEIWPNFLRQCQKRDIPVLLVNGRMASASFGRYRLARPVTAAMFRRLAAICVQDPTYAEWFKILGAPADRIQVTGTMKFDTATIAQSVPGDAELASALGLHPGQEPIWVCGSTGPGEEELILCQYRKLLTQLPALRLALIPRKPERFDEVAALIESQGFPLLRRSRADQIANRKSQIANAVILGDTMGELRKFYSLADVVFVGRTLVDLGSRQHGSDMMEPAALAKPVIVGPFTGNFAETMNRFRERQAIREVRSETDLAQAVADLLTHRAQAAAMATRAQETVRDNQGATARHAQVILQHLPASEPATTA